MGSVIVQIVKNYKAISLLPTCTASAQALGVAGAAGPHVDIRCPAGAVPTLTAVELAPVRGSINIKEVVSSRIIRPLLLGGPYNDPSSNTPALLAVAEQGRRAPRHYDTVLLP